MNTLFLAIMTSLATLGSCTQVEDTLGDTDYPSKGVQGATYYLDSESGDDSQDGMSPETAWKTLGRLEKVYLQAGNAILLRCGSSWDGQLAPRGSGTQSAPIRIGHYGEGSLPVINGCGEVDAAVKLSNQSYWIIEGIEVTNLAPERDIYRCGIHIENNGGGTVSGIVIRNNRVHDVTSSFDYSDVYHPHQFGGISVSTKSVTVAEEKFDDILIEGNEVERVGRTGIVVWDFVWGSNTQSSTNVIIRGNTVREVDSDGILTYGCNGSLIEYNLADGCRFVARGGRFQRSRGDLVPRGVRSASSSSTRPAIRRRSKGMTTVLDSTSTLTLRTASCSTTTATITRAVSCCSSMPTRSRETAREGASSVTTSAKTTASGSS